MRRERASKDRRPEPEHRAALQAGTNHGLFLVSGLLSGGIGCTIDGRSCCAASSRRDAVTRRRSSGLRALARNHPRTWSASSTSRTRSASASDGAPCAARERLRARVVVVMIPYFLVELMPYLRCSPVLRDSRPGDLLLLPKVSGPSLALPFRNHLAGHLGERSSRCRRRSSCYERQFLSRAAE